MTKITNKVALTLAIALIDYAEEKGAVLEADFDGDLGTVKEKLSNMIASLDKKSAKPNTKQSKVQQENEAIKDEILNLLADGQHRQALEVAAALDLTSSQKAAALLRQLVMSGEVAKEKEKGKTLFFLSPDFKA